MKPPFRSKLSFLVNTCSFFRMKYSQNFMLKANMSTSKAFTTVNGKQKGQGRYLTCVLYIYAIIKCYG